MNTLPEGYSFGGLISTTMAPRAGRCGCDRDEESLSERTLFRRAFPGMSTRPQTSVPQTSVYPWLGPGWVTKRNCL